MIKKPSTEEAKQAIRTLLKYIGEDLNREGLVETPRRVVESYAEFFRGYKKDPKRILKETFEDVGEYNDIILLKNMRLESYCEHHMVPIIGKSHVAYLPNKKVVGISKIAQVVDIFAKRLQTQERLTTEIGLSIKEALQPQGVSVLIDSAHHCMTTRGVHKTEASIVTTYTCGVFKEDNSKRNQLMSLISEK